MKTLSDIYNGIVNSPSKTFAALEKESISYKELHARILRFSGLFAQLDVQCDQRIILCSDNESFVISAVAAAFLNGISSTVLTTETSLARVESIVEQAQPQLILIDEKLQSIWQLQGDFSLYVIASKKDSGSSLMKRFIRDSKKSWRENLNEFTQQQPELPSKLNNNCFINFTSGTTGDAKGVQITYHNFISHMETLKKVFSYTQNSKVLNNMILAHADGLLQGPMLALYNCCSLYRPCNMDVQHLEILLNTIFRERITHMLTVPTVLSFIDRLAEHDDYFESEYFSHLISVAGMLDINIWQRLEQRFSTRINNIYGLTETVAGGIFCGPSDNNFLYGTIGKPVDIDIRIMDENNNDCSTNEQGELWLKGDNVFSGYFNKEDVSQQVFEDHWFKTGDIATIDEQGFVSICGRCKELIISGGFNIHPAEVNEAIMRHDDVAEVATLGLPDSEWQEIVVSAVVLKSKNKIDNNTLISHCRNWLEPKKIPRHIYFVDHLPKGDSGKVSLPQLKEQLESLKSNIANNASLLNEAALIKLAAEVFQIDKAQLSMQSKVGETPGWDSLGHLTLVVRIEKITEKTLTAQQIMAITSLADILEFTSA
jgi:long-chain acyl-CoA synthetase